MSNPNFLEAQANAEVAIAAHRLRAQGLGGHALYLALAKQFHPNSTHNGGTGKRDELSRRMQTVNSMRETLLLEAKRSLMEIPEHVSVGGRRGNRWSGPICADQLTFRPQPDRSYSMLDLPPTATNIAMRMSTGDIAVLSVANPDEPDNHRREYSLTSVAMNKGRQPGQGLRALTLPYETVANMLIEPGQHHTVVMPDKIHVSEGVITELVTYDRTLPLNPAEVNRLPASTIAADFHALVGA